MVLCGHIIILYPYTTRRYLSTLSTTEFDSTISPKSNYDTNITGRRERATARWSHGTVLVIASTDNFSSWQK